LSQDQIFVTKTLRFDDTKHVISSLVPWPFRPAFVACSADMRESLVKFVMRRVVPGCWVDVWSKSI